jgi:hypothetical protein
LELDATAALQRADDGGLVAHAGTDDAALLRGAVHVPGRATDVGLVDFDPTVELVEAAGLHRQPDPVEHEPGRLLSNADRTG